MFQFTQPYNNDCVHLHKNAQRVIQWTGSGTTSTLPSNNRVGVALLYTRDRIGCHGIREGFQLHGEVTTHFAHLHFWYTLLCCRLFFNLLGVSSSSPMPYKLLVVVETSAATIQCWYRLLYKIQ